MKISIGNACRVLLSALAIGLLASKAQAQTPDKSKVHFYIYNECDLPLEAKTQFIDLQNETSIKTTSVDPGNQRMVFYAEEQAIKTGAASKPEKLVWKEIELVIDRGEYTHVLACSCDTAKSKCPQLWPNPPSRQQAE